LSWLGYPGTTGLTAVDYYLADKHWLPPGRFDDVFTEKLAYLPDRWAFEPYHLTPPVNPLPALESGRLTFGSFHRLGKINSGTMDLWARLLLAVPQSTLLIAGIPLDGREQTLSGEFANRGVDPQRLAFHGRSPMDIYLALHHRVDIGLDTQPYAGATTTMYSLTMGVPTLTVAGATPAARGCAGILGQLGLAEFIGADADGFVEKGRHWAERLPELAQLRMGIRARMSRSPGGQPALIAAHFEAALRHMWRRWCAGLPPESFATGATVEMPR
jgi:predicted O-linked N-acetylglucosamine transferase (SPINDLY family)